jgi:hypothetical protein
MEHSGERRTMAPADGITISGEGTEGARNGRPDRPEDAPMTDARATPLAEFSTLRHGARMTPFAGWALPLNYPPGVKAEHEHTREAVSLFDVSHMGQVALRPGSGDPADAARALEALVPGRHSGPCRRRHALHPADHRFGWHHRRSDGDAAGRRPAPGAQRRPGRGRHRPSAGPSAGRCDDRAAGERRADRVAGAAIGRGTGAADP